ncbi:uncharacterized protein LOC123295442 [Chrysoperla carnea]|uniref:uncharacterized protein LOC123295442 n=1 Tax=Chrysoperla carnea TaxID=189513 RepID=UPI001D07E76C|nr:uncharacterized protein LOC123295442 [Chrysoperla carnea]
MNTFSSKKSLKKVQKKAITKRMGLEFEEIDTLNLRDTALPFACSWSEDDTLSVLSENEVHILKLKPNMRTVENTVNFHRQTIKPRNEYPNKEILPLLHELIMKEPRINVYDLLNDVILTPDGKALDCQDITPRCSQCVWSPAGVHKSNCALIFLSNIGNVDIQVNQGQFWIVIADLTKLYLQKTNLFKDLNHSTINYETLKDRTYKASTTCVDWSPLYGNMSYIVTGQMNGDIIIWNFSNLSLSELKQMPELVGEFPSNLSRLSAVHWIKTSNTSSLIIAGDLDGDIKGFRFDDLINFENDINSHNYWIYNDKIRVDKIISEQIDTNYLLICVKLSNIVAFLISNTGELLDQKIHKVGNLAVTGLQQINRGKYLLCTLTSYLGLLTVDIKGNKIINIHMTEINNPINTNYMSTYGLCCSKQKVMWFISSNYCKPINHLIIREQIQLSVCSNNFNNIESILLENFSQKLTNYWDCLELLRLLHDKSDSLTKIYEQRDSYDLVPLYRLKIYLWITISNDNVLKKKKRAGSKPITNEISTPPEELLKLVKIKYCLERLQSLMILDVLSEFDLCSVRYLRDYLQEMRKTETFKSYLGKQTNEEIIDVLERSASIRVMDLMKCSLCDADVTWIGKCLNGHQENQCIRTFVPFSSLWYPTCPNCESPAHPDLKEDPLICSICDNIMVYCDHKILHNDTI